MSDLRVLAVDDEPDMLAAIARVLARPGLEIVTAPDGAAALGKLRADEFDVLVADLRMPGMDGLSLVQAARDIDPGITAIVLTAFPSVETAVSAMRRGAFDYVSKPFDPEQLRSAIDHALANRQVEWEARLVRHDLAHGGSFHGMAGRSRAIRAVFDVVERAAPGEANVLVLGESGTGKELVARAIHECSRRAAGRFVPVDCGALPENLLESELFGHEQGAFTGAVRTTPGILEFADGGTFFLDEICEMPLALQAKLLRALQERKFRRVGGRELIDADVRVVAATNRDIEREVRAGRFRADLFYRLDVVRICVPPLSERTDDIPMLATRFLDATGGGPRNVRGIAAETMEVLVRHRWPGNVRELRNAIERAVSLTRHDFLQPDDLPEAVRDRERDTAGRPLGPYLQSRADRIAEFEREYLAQILRATHGNVSHAARIAEITRCSLHRLMRRHDLRSDDFAG